MKYENWQYCSSIVKLYRYYIEKGRGTYTYEL